jgi:hypothetical protein
VAVVLEAAVAAVAAAVAAEAEAIGAAAVADPTRALLFCAA